MSYSDRCYDVKFGLGREGSVVIDRWEGVESGDSEQSAVGNRGNVQHEDGFSPSFTRRTLSC